MLPADVLRRLTENNIEYSNVYELRIRHEAQDRCNYSLTYSIIGLTFRQRASSILGQAFHYSPENAFYIFNQQIYFII